MGLLDDAIREHLELKRRHGADPDEVTRQEREALGAPQRNAEFAQPEGADDPGAAEAPEEDPEPEPEPDLGAVAASEAAPPAEDEAPPAEVVRAGAEEDPWLPDEEEPAPPGEETPAEPGDDVLEETPEFLQETPEHDRLWFEQKPPRDFDWDK